MTRTYATMELSASAFTEIRNKLSEAGYDQAFHDEGGGLILDGIMVVQGNSPSLSFNLSDRAFNEVYALVKAAGLTGVLVDADAVLHGVDKIVLGDFPLTRVRKDDDDITDPAHPEHPSLCLFPTTPCKPECDGMNHAPGCEWAKYAR